MNIKFLAMGVLATMLAVACNNQNQSQGSGGSANAADSSAVQAEGEESGPKGVIEFSSSEYNFGTVKEGEVVEHIFKFKNTGDAPVILSQVSASCGCTTPDYTKDPVLPGKEGEIKVSFNSQGQVGNQQKIVTVGSNAAVPVTTIQIKGIVEAK